MKKTAVVVLIFVLLLGGVVYWLWHRVTLLPEWYTGAEAASEGIVISYGKGMEEIRKSLEQTIEGQLQKAPKSTSEATIVLNENDANKLFATLISENANTYRYLQAIKASRTRIKNGNLDFGVVVDASEVLRDASGGSAEAMRPETTHLAGLLQGREVALGFTGKHGLKDGKLRLDDAGKIRIGGLTFSLKTITKRLGVPEDNLKKALKDIELGKFKINYIKTSRNNLLLKGSVSTP